MAAATTTSGGVSFKYKTGIATLRSSAHRVKYSLDHRKHDPKPVSKDGEPANTFLPDEICRENVVAYSTEEYDFHGAIVDLLRRCDEGLVGTFQSFDDNSHKGVENGVESMTLEDNALDLSFTDGVINGHAPTSTSKVALPIGKSHHKLENFAVPLKSLTRKCQKGIIEEAQKYLSEMVSSDIVFLNLFDRFVENFVLPHLKHRLQAIGVEKAFGPLTFYYQRPPTLRIQPGPARGECSLSLPFY